MTLETTIEYLAKKRKEFEEEIERIDSLLAILDKAQKKGIK